MKKKLWLIGCIAILLVSLCSFSLGESTTYSVDKLGYSIKIPNSHFVLHYGIEDGDPIFDILTASKEDIFSLLDEANYDLYAAPFDFSHTLVVSHSINLVRFSLETALLDININEYLGVVKSDLENNGFTNVEVSAQDINGWTFIKTKYEIHSLEGITYRIAYSTSTSRSTIITMREQWMPYTVKEELDFDKIVQSIRINPI